MTGTSQTGTDIKKATFLLRGGKCVAIPTETVYGLAANAFDSAAVASIFEIKNRPFFDPLIVHIGNADQISKLAVSFPEKAKSLTEKFWPGPLTIILPKSDSVPDIVCAGLPSVGIRMPDHKLTLDLLNSLEFPLAAPSANPFGYISPTIAQHVVDQLGNKIEYILDGGPCRVGLESTIVSFVSEKPTVLRFGGIDLEDIEAVIGKVIVEHKNSEAPAAPGMLSSHYAPLKKLLFGRLDDLISQNTGLNYGVLALSDLKGQKGIILSESGNLKEAAQNLFAAMRLMDNSSYDLILTEEMPDHGLGRAINDRLSRASY